MRILVDFINGNDYWESKVLASAKRGSEILSDPDFLATVAAHAGFDFCNQSPQQVADTIRNAGDVMIKVGFYRGWPWSKVLASEGGGQVSFNTRKESVGAGGVENTVHETLHALGFIHNGNSPAGNLNTVPWWVGILAGGWKVTTAGKVDGVPVEAL